MNNTVTREHAARWARSLRFLTFDEDDTQDASSIGTGLDQERSIRGQCQRCENRLPVPSGHICERHRFKTDDIENREEELRKYSNPCVHFRELSCQECLHVPNFPNRGTITKFRIRRLTAPDSESLPLCTHFVAVSYCWASQSAGSDVLAAADEPYSVVEEDGRMRPVRAQKVTIDRAVNFARENGFRMIWIDQVSLPSLDSIYYVYRMYLGVFSWTDSYFLGMYRARQPCRERTCHPGHGLRVPDSSYIHWAIPDSASTTPS